MRNEWKYELRNSTPVRPGGAPCSTPLLNCQCMFVNHDREEDVHQKEPDRNEEGKVEWRRKVGPHSSHLSECVPTKEQEDEASHRDIKAAKGREMASVKLKGNKRKRQH